MSIAECFHPRLAHVINNDDMVVCSECALVLNEFARLQYAAPLWKHERQALLCQGVDDFKDMVADICEGMHLPDKFVTEAVDFFVDFSKHETKKRSQSSLNKFAAACVYIVCKNSGVPRMLSEVCQHSDVTEQDAWRVLVQFGYDVEMISSADLIARFSDALNFTYKMQRDIQNIIAHLPLKFETLNPRTVCALCTILYIENKGLKHDLYTCKSICKLYGVSVVNIRRHIKASVTQLEGIVRSLV